MKKRIQLSILLITINFALKAQTLPVGMPVLEEYTRRAQLTGDTTYLASHMMRPLFIPHTNPRKPELKLLPVIWKQHYTTDHPMSLNDGAMIPARGYQTLLSAGVFARYGIFSVQLMPEFVYAANKPFDGFPDALNDKMWQVYNSVKNDIDLPDRFGDDPYRKLFWGQSSARITYRALSFGISTENLWWGPGMKNTLLMTNNAPGFAHLTFNTVRPIKTPIGSFEGQIIGGRLEASGFPGVDTARLAGRGLKANTKRDDWRYLNAMTLSYQPRWLPGLVLGVSRSFTLYGGDINSSYRTWFPLFEPILKKEVGGEVADTIASDQVASAYVRWLMPESNSEVYFEYGRGDHSWDFTDLALEPDHYRAYVVGFRKMVPLTKRKGEYLDIQTELTVLNRNLVSSLRMKNSPAVWYVHGRVQHGYTHMGQILGSGIGPSGNMQTASLSWVRGMKRLGIELLRYAHDEDFWAYSSQVTGYGDYRTHWVDVGATLLADWHYQNFLVGAKLSTVGSINYMFHYDPIPSDPPFWWDRGAIRWNGRLEVSLAYLLR